MKIRSLTLTNIGVFEDETIFFPKKKDKDLAEIHILTGQNGTGKTTILQALAVLILSIKNPFIEHLNPDTVHFYSEYLLDKKRISEFLEPYFFAENESGERLKPILKQPATYIKKSTFNSDFIYDFSAFSYSGYRFIEHEENINIKNNQQYNPLENALDFNKTYGKNDYTLNQWLANNISKRSFARDEGNEEKAKIFDKNIKLLEQIIEAIIEKPIKFEPVYETGIKIVANIKGKKLDFDLLPDGLRSIISWLGDLIMRMDALKWKDDLPVFEREFILFLDEIEVHLHPSWQRKILPVVQKLFKNAQIFITTHSPFIVNSIDGAFIYELKLDTNGHCKSEKPTISSTSIPIDEVLNEIYDIEPTQMYGQPVEKEIEDFQESVQKAYKKDSDFNKKDLLKKAKKLALKSPELQNNVQFELRQLSKSLAEDFTI